MSEWPKYESHRCNCPAAKIVNQERDASGNVIAARNRSSGWLVFKGDCS